MGKNVKETLSKLQLCTLSNGHWIEEEVRQARTQEDIILKRKHRSDHLNQNSNKQNKLKIEITFVFWKNTLIFE